MNRAMGAGIVGGLAVLGLLAGASQGSMEGALVGLTVGGLVGLTGVVSTQLSGSSQLLGAGLLTLFLGERMLGSGTERAVVSGFGLLVVLAAVGIRVAAMGRSEGRTKAAHQLALVSSAVVVAGLVVYGLTLESAVSAFLKDDESIWRWKGALGAIWPILVLVGMAPTMAVDRILALHPRVLPPRAAKEAATQALSAALAVALVFPVNYLASRHEWSSDVAYFRTTAAGESTVALVKTLTEPVEAILFFPAGNDVGEEVEPYFRTLEAASGGMLKVTRVDQALAPALSEELKIRDNGFVAFRMGESQEKFKVGEDLSKSKRNLKKLDETAQKHLLKVTRGQRTAYFVVGHGEANFRERDNPLRKLALFKKVLESQNYKASNLGAAEGLANAVPDDADLVILAAPEKPLLPEESESLKNYLDQGGALLVMTDTAADPMTDLLGYMGLSAGTHALAHAKAHVRQTRGPGDRVLLATNRYGSHQAVRTLSKNGTTLQVVLPAAVKIAKTETGGEAKVHTLVRSFPDTWEDVDDDRQKDGDEPGEVFDLAVAVTGPEKADGKGWRAMVVGDTNWASDSVIQSVQGNQVLLLDGLRWLVGDEDLAGEVSNEEDVKIQHTKGQDWVWFYLTVLAVPLLVFGVGVVSIRMRRRA
ncbi:MAG: Gldg family protein [Alphaproteobacteria bacterium]|nr:Gldg family protein [Alphaproteobacteria bacterium]MCB9694877.1 Gldg family protein [Alphaproteobacteria bacterium]